ncbi:peptide chain release factor N(5)-glutamine methyltransferase [Apilactobacillus sp. TMW 2.2459]|uniref:peptide chain release factor N(5)-glutamine methyltransferase n=1 Tax=Apilactobacillus xinyiensis TaxID=2841032 RepID=UPI00200D8B06|nr:peptide chain release factor N(5)-glutamine methyltransferase [Apilactobacillus xinyiensis]MCL0311563.1 peptide chain release factor N(5)-glutamine methyltransferase [Apilactobacillus xinyiensis]
MNKLTYFEAQKRASLCIKAQNLPTDTAKYLMMERLNWDDVHLLMHYRDVMPDNQLLQFQSDVQRFINGEPAQYIIGKAHFYGNELSVDSNVLIPRPETEELVDWILNDNSNEPLNVLDVGTGSGAIAIALKQQRPKWQVWASDISEPALNVAKKNAHDNNVDINFRHSDLFTNINGEFDIIVSNPPYISNDETPYMDKSVLKYEPYTALFAENNGLELYQRISLERGDVSKQDATLYLEIGFKQEDAVVDIFKQHSPLSKIETKQDLANHPRMVKIQD